MEDGEEREQGGREDTREREAGRGRKRESVVREGIRETGIKRQGRNMGGGRVTVTWENSDSMGQIAVHTLSILSRHFPSFPLTV